MDEPLFCERSLSGAAAQLIELGALETAANPYITVCGPPRYAEMRINISQAFNGIGTVNCSCPWLICFLLENIGRYTVS